MIEAWDALAARLNANAFMHPAALQAAAETGFAEIYVLLAWDETTTPRRPVGFWAMRVRNDLPLIPAFLDALPYNYAFTSNPVIDGACAEDVVAAFFDAVRRDARLPKVIRLRSFVADPVVHPAMIRHLAGTGRYREFACAERPVADRSSGTKKSGSTRKKLRQDWNRLSAAGAVEIVNLRTPVGAEAAFETFLALEAASWKGAEGTALLSDARDAGFSRRLILNLAALGLASVALLSVDGDAIAAQVLLYSGQCAYTWKTAFKASYARFSPGALLIDKATEGLFESGRIASIDSCSYADGIMAQLWTGRSILIDALIDVRPRNLLGFAVEVAQHRGYELILSMRRRMRSAIKRCRVALKKASPAKASETIADRTTRA